MPLLLVNSSFLTNNITRSMSSSLSCTSSKMMWVQSFKCFLAIIVFFRMPVVTYSSLVSGLLLPLSSPTW